MSTGGWLDCEGYVVQFMELLGYYWRHLRDLLCLSWRNLSSFQVECPGVLLVRWNRGGVILSSWKDIFDNAELLCLFCNSNRTTFDVLRSHISNISAHTASNLHITHTFSIPKYSSRSVHPIDPILKAVSSILRNTHNNKNQQSNRRPKTNTRTVSHIQILPTFTSCHRLPPQHFSLLVPSLSCMHPMYMIWQGWVLGESL